MPDSPDEPDLPEHGPRSGATAAIYRAGGTAAVTLALFVDRPHLRDQLREDALATGYQVVEAGTLEALAARGRASAAAVVLIDCPAPTPASLAALARQDMAAHERGTQLIVATQLDHLEGVFGCLDQSQPQLLVDASSSDLVLALGRALALSGRGLVHELAEADRRLLLRLSDQVSRLAARLDRLEDNTATEPTDRLAAPAIAFRAADEPLVLSRGGQPSRWPSAPLVRRILRQRQQRAVHFGPDLFADPAWDMLLDLTAARGEGKRVSVTSLCIAAGVPATTALRWIAQMTEAGLFERLDDTADRRRAFIDLTERAAAGMVAYFASLGDEAGLVV